MAQKKFLPFLFVLIFFSNLIWAAPKPGDFVAQGPAGQKKMTLTFDDGPGAHTEAFLNLLEKYQVKATFFMLGQQAKTRPRVAKMVFDRGHEIGSHTYSHVNYLKHLKNLEAKYGNPGKAKDKAQADLLADMKKTRQILEQTGAKIQICRMPHGIDRPWIKNVAKQEGVVLVNWTFGADWTKLPFEKLKNGYIQAVKPGAILLFHDDGKNWEQTLQIVEAVIVAAREKGYSIVPVLQLF